MKRGSFFKSVATILIAPKILSRINLPIARKSQLPAMGLFNDLQLLTPSYYKAYVEKYGDVNYVEILSSETITI